jgi:hypothetical protein
VRAAENTGNRPLACRQNQTTPTYRPREASYDRNKKIYTPPNWRHSVFITRQRSGEHTNTQPNVNVVYKFVTHLTWWLGWRKKPGHRQHFLKHTLKLETRYIHPTFWTTKNLQLSYQHDHTHPLTHSHTQPVICLLKKPEHETKTTNFFEIFFFLRKTYFPHRYIEIYASAFLRRKESVLE